MKRFEEYAPDERKAMAEFSNYMKEVVRNGIRNVVRDYLAGAERNGGLCMDDVLDEGLPGLCVSEEEAFGKRYLFTRFAGGVGIGFDDEKLARVLDSLPAGEREVLLLGTGAGLSTEELAAALNLKAGSARARKSKALADARRAEHGGKD